MPSRVPDTRRLLSALLRLTDAARGRRDPPRRLHPATESARVAATRAPSSRSSSGSPRTAATSASTERAASTQRSSSTFSIPTGSIAARSSASLADADGDERIVALGELRAPARPGGGGGRIHRRRRSAAPRIGDAAARAARSARGRRRHRALRRRRAARERSDARRLPQTPASRSSRTLEGGEIEVRFPIAPTEQFRARVEERDHIAVAASLRPFFAPAGVAVIGASKRRGTIGGELFRNIIAADFAGAAYPVNRTGEAVAGVRAYRIDRGDPRSRRSRRDLRSGRQRARIGGGGAAEGRPRALRDLRGIRRGRRRGRRAPGAASRARPRARRAPRRPELPRHRRPAHSG